MLDATQAPSGRWPEIEQGDAVHIVFELGMKRHAELSTFDIREIADEDGVLKRIAEL